MSLCLFQLNIIVHKAPSQNYYGISCGESFSAKGISLQKRCVWILFLDRFFAETKHTFTCNNYVYRLPNEQSVVWPTDKISQPFAVLRSQSIFMKCDMPEVLIKDNVVLLDVNERA